MPSVQGSAPKSAEPERGVARVQSLALELVGDRERVRGRGHQHRRREVADQLDLALGLSARHRHHRRAEALGTVVRAQAAGEEPVAERDVDDVRLARAGRAERPRHHVGPGLDVALRVPDDGRPAGRPARSVNAHDLAQRHGEHAERVVRPQVVLGGEREAREIPERPELAGMNARGVELRPVVRHALVHPNERRAEPLELESAQLVGRRKLGRRDIDGETAVSHAGFPGGKRGCSC